MDSESSSFSFCSMEDEGRDRGGEGDFSSFWGSDDEGRGAIYG